MSRLDLAATIGSFGFICFTLARIPIFWNWISKNGIINTAIYDRTVEPLKPNMVIYANLDAWVIDFYIRQSKHLTDGQKSSLESITNTLIHNKDEFMLSEVKCITIVKAGMEVLTISLDSDREWYMFIEINEYDDYCSQWSTRIPSAIILVAVFLFLW